MNPTKMPRGVGYNDHQQTGGRGRSCRNPDARKTPSSTISDTSTKRTKYEETTDEKADLFPTTDDDSTALNWKNKALTRSSPHGRHAHKKSDE